MTRWRQFNCRCTSFVNFVWSCSRCEDANGGILDFLAGKNIAKRVGHYLIRKGQKYDEVNNKEIYSRVEMESVGGV